MGIFIEIDNNEESNSSRKMTDQDKYKETVNEITQIEKTLIKHSKKSEARTHKKIIKVKNLPRRYKSYYQKVDKRKQRERKCQYHKRGRKEFDTCMKDNAWMKHSSVIVSTICKENPEKCNKLNDKKIK